MSDSKTSYSFLTASVLVAVGLGLGWLLTTQFQTLTPSVAEDPEPAAGSTSQEIVEMSEMTLKNMGMTNGTFAVQDYFQKVQVPAEIVEMLPAGRRQITAPIGGRIKRVLISPRQIVKPGDKLFEMQVTDQMLSEAQVNYIELLAQIDVNKRKLERLKPLAETGAVAGKRLLDVEFELKTMEARLKAARQKLSLRGMNETQIEHLTTSGELVQNVIVRAPSFDDAPNANEPALTTELDQRFKRVSIEFNDTNFKKQDQDEEVSKSPNDEKIKQADESESKNELEAHDFFTVESVDALQGKILEPGQPLCVLTHHGDLLIKGMAFESDVQSISEASQKNWTFNAIFGESPHTYLRENLKIHSLDNHVEDGTQTYGVYVSLKNELLSQRTDEKGRKFVNWKFKPGQRVHLEIPVNHWERQCVAPISALVREGPESFVFKLVDHTHELDDGTILNEYIKVPVKVLHFDQHQVVLAKKLPLDVYAEYALDNAYQLNLALKQAASSGTSHGHAH